MLFAVMLAGKHPRAKVEVHDVVCVVADSVEQAYPQVRDGWFGSPKEVHIDSWMAVDGVDNWRVEFSSLAPSSDSPRPYFIKLGGYGSQTFGEAHRYLLVVAEDKREAMVDGKSRP